MTGRGGLVRRATDRTLARHDLDSTRDGTLIATGQITESVVALLSGAVDAAMLSPPGTFQAEDEGMRLLVNTHEHHFPAVIAGTRAWVSQHEDLTRQTLQALAAGIAFSHAVSWRGWRTSCSRRVRRGLNGSSRTAWWPRSSARASSRRSAGRRDQGAESGAGSAVRTSGGAATGRRVRASSQTCVVCPSASRRPSLSRRTV